MCSGSLGKNEGAQPRGMERVDLLLPAYQLHAAAREEPRPNQHIRYK